jgi:exopolyphosphatase/guanosine-5'-triphosphate,3'-diphosphate pyrophosphatase
VAIGNEGTSASEIADLVSKIADAANKTADATPRPIRVAALDCGTNTFRLYVADVYSDGTQRQLCRESEIVRLGYGVDRTGEIAPESLERALAAARRYGAILEQLQPEKVRMVATSASRDARNSADFVRGVEAAIGVTPEVISGEAEAALAFAGATRGLAGRFPAPYLVGDLGGGSTELVLGTDSVFGEDGVIAAFSMDVGSVRLTERRLVSDPPSDTEIALAHGDVAAMLEAAHQVVPVEQARTIVGVAGTVTSLAAYHLGLKVFDPQAIDGLALTVPEAERQCAEMLAMTRAERLALGFMQPGRADIIGAGALIWHDVVAYVSQHVAAAGGKIEAVVARDSDMLEGIAASLAFPSAL